MALISSLEKGRVDKPAKEVYENFEKDTGSIPEWVKVMAHSPKILKEFVDLFKAVMGSGDIKPVLKWEIAYVVSQTLKCPFCIDVSEKMLKKLGCADDIINQIKEKTRISSKEGEIFDLIRDVTLDGHLDKPELFDKLKEKFNEKQIVEIISVMGLFNYINRFNNTLAVLPE